MTIRPLRPSDLAPLHALYTSLTSLKRVQPKPGLEQFTAELTSTRWQEDEHWALDSNLTFIADNGRGPVAYAYASFLERDARHSSLKAGTGVLRCVLCEPDDADACRMVVRAVVAEAARRGCDDLRAFDGYGPVFGNAGSSNTWPWIGRTLLQEGFEAHGRPGLEMYRRLDNPIERLMMPEGAVLRYDWVTRLGERDGTEGGFQIFFDADRAAETMWHFGEKYVWGAGCHHAYLFWLGTNAPYRGRGLGRILLRETLARVQELGARESSLHCRVDNLYAHAIYRAEGYVPSDLTWSFRHAGAHNAA